MERWVCQLSCPFGVHHEVTDTSKTEASGYAIGLSKECIMCCCISVATGNVDRSIKGAVCCVVKNECIASLWISKRTLNDSLPLMA